MLGAIIGDIAGSTREFKNVKTLNFPLFEPGSCYTDDTICTIAIADAAMHGLPYDVTLAKWCQKYPFPMGGYGASFNQWIYDPLHHSYNSWGNGSPMRVSPIGWLFRDTETTIIEARKQSVVSHNHPIAVQASVLVALTIKALRSGGTLSDIKKMYFDSYGIIPEYKPFSVAFNERADTAVTAAFTCLFASDSFSDAVRKSVAIGGDSDTIAAITGSLAEAYFGLDTELAEKAFAMLPEDMGNIVSEFYERIKK